MDLLKEKCFELWERFKVELILILISGMIAVSSGYLLWYLNYTTLNNYNYVEPDPSDNPSETKESNKIYVDISGAVIEPDVYEVVSGSRLKDVLIKAQGLSKSADRQYVSQNINLAEVVVDQQKIYIPTEAEVSGKGLYLTQKNNLLQVNNTQDRKININEASAGELDTLSGVGPVTAEKIINNRPYASIEEIVEKKIIGQTAFAKIKNNITVR